MSSEFVHFMSDKMWKYINENTIIHVIRSAGCDSVNSSFKENIEDDFYTCDYRNTICFKGDRRMGHYVFVDDDLNAFGTYECDYILPEDDGVCHGQHY